MFSGAVPICRELNPPAGPSDNFMVTPSGLPVLVECKLWRNPEARREVVTQILDYAKELSRWSSSDVVYRGSDAWRNGKYRVRRLPSHTLALASRNGGA